jgi:hypothetical protein
VSPHTAAAVHDRSSRHVRVGARCGQPHCPATACCVRCGPDVVPQMCVGCLRPCVDLLRVGQATAASGEAGVVVAGKNGLNYEVVVSRRRQCCERSGAGGLVEYGGAGDRRCDGVRVCDAGRGIDARHRQQGDNRYFDDRSLDVLSDSNLTVSDQLLQVPMDGFRCVHQWIFHQMGRAIALPLLKPDTWLECWRQRTA